MTRPNLQRLRRNDSAMIRQICNVKPEDVASVRTKELFTRLGLGDLEVVLREKRLCWFGHLERSSGAIRTAYDMQVDGRSGPGRPKMTWRAAIERDRKEWTLSEADLCDRITWRSKVRSAGRAASQIPGEEPTDVEDAPEPAC